MKISCIIPCYNEEGRVGQVLDVALSAKFVNEIVVVDNASTDNTVAEIKQRKDNRIKLIIHKQNLGKGSSVKDGFNNSTGDVVFILDSDLKNLTIENIRNLVTPITNGDYDLVLSDRTEPFSSFAGAWFITGEKSFRRKEWREFFKGYQERGYSIEQRINEYALNNKMKIGVVRWPNVVAISKMSKDGFFPGFVRDIKMYQNLCGDFGYINFASQWWKIRKMAKRI